MLLSRKIRIIPTKEQEILFHKSCGVARWAYNFFLAKQREVYAEYLANNKQGEQYVKEGEVRKYINNVLKPTTHTWLREVGSNVMKQAVKDADDAYKKYFKHLAKKPPKFKSKHKSKLSFYVNYESLSRKQGGFQGEKIGFVRTSENLPKLPKGKKYSNPRITFDGKYWYLSVGYEVENNIQELTNESIGIDLGIKEIATCSNGKVYKNINKTKRVRQLKKRLKRMQRKVSKKYEMNKQGNKFVKTNNVIKLEREIKLINRTLTNIRNNYIHQITTKMVKAKPYRVVMEDLNVSGMMKNKHLAEAIAEQKFYMFIQTMKYKCEFNGIKFIQIDRFYPSSKTCSHCGHIKKDLKLSDRVYKCDECGLEIDRDLNASINLANYKLA